MLTGHFIEMKEFHIETKPPSVLKGLGPYIMARHIRSKFWSIPVGKIQNSY